MTVHLLPTLALAAAVVFSSAAAPSVAVFPGSIAADAPCTLLTADEIKTVLTASVQPGQPSESDGAHSCTWKDAKGADRVYLNVKDAKEWKSFRDSMQATGKMTAVTGLAEDAFFVGSSGSSAALYTLKKGHVALLTVDGEGFSRAENEAAEKALAVPMLAKL